MICRTAKSIANAASSISLNLLPKPVENRMVSPARVRFSPIAVST